MSTAQEYKQRQKLSQADPSHYNAVLDLFRAVSKNLYDRGIDQWDDIYPDAQTLKMDIDSHQMMILEGDARIVAAVVLNEQQDEQYKQGDWMYANEKVAVIHRLCVSPQFQGQGIGREVLHQAELYLIEKGYRSIRLDAFLKNPHAMKLYEDSGYRKAGKVIFRKGEFCLFEKLLSRE